jgi:hypothetical protein
VWCEKAKITAGKKAESSLCMDLNVNDKESYEQRTTDSPPQSEYEYVVRLLNRT